MYIINSDGKSCIIGIEKDYDTALSKSKLYNKLEKVHLYEYESDTSIDDDLEHLLEIENIIDNREE
jgi:hypothetical protein